MQPNYQKSAPEYFVQLVGKFYLSLEQNKLLDQMFQFHYQQGLAGRLALFPHILELCIRKNSSIQLHSFTEKVAEGLYAVNGRSYYIQLSDKAVQPVLRELNGRKELLVPAEKKCVTEFCSNWLRKDCNRYR